MSDEPITRVSVRRKTGQTDLARLESLSDEAIAEAVRNDRDAARLDIDWSRAEVVMPVRKVPISIRLDEDVLTFFREAGDGYQSRINAVLRSFMQARRDDGSTQR